VPRQYEPGELVRTSLAEMRRTTSVGGRVNSRNASSPHRLIASSPRHCVALTILALLVIRVPKDTAVQQRPVDIGHHRTDVPRRIRLAVGRVLDRLEVLDRGGVEVERVALVERVDLASGRDLDVGVGEDELAQRLVEGEAVHALASGEDEVARGTVPKRGRVSGESKRGDGIGRVQRCNTSG
jgi:hypothetical protein